ncbi:MAG TPA: T9SS type A sorting domain-containing protein [Bacteroidetes bacterium]|nr:T9SS type A sorting domain-containing protein [Bacteroidota bacterium]
MKSSTCMILFILVITHLTLAETTPILIGGEGTELSEEGVLTGNGSSAMGGLGAAVLDTFIIYYQPLGEGDWVDNIFPDPEVYSFQMDLVDHLPVWQSRGRHGDFWDSRGRNGDGIYPWINRDWRGGQYYNHQYRAAGDDPPFGHVHSNAEWTINYWDGDENNRFIHTCLSGTVDDFVFDRDTGDATALLMVYESIYCGYRENGEPGPGHVEYPGGAYQGFDSFREPSGRFSHLAFFFEYDGGSNTGSLTPCGTKITLIEDGWIKGYFDRVQTAIDSAVDGDTLLLKPEEYIENIDFNGKNIVIGSLYMTTGNEGYIESTVIDGDANGSVVNFTSEETEDAQLIGLNIRNGNTDDMGGGINCRNSSPTIRNCFIRNNYAGTRGGGISCEPSASPVIDNCWISENESGSGGGGIWCGDNSHPTLTNCAIVENSAGWNGAGINMYIDCHPTITSCIISFNSATHKGGGVIVSQDCSPVFSGCNITLNESIDNGGGITVERNAAPTFRRCVIDNNSTEGAGGAVACLENSTANFINCVMSWNEAHIDNGTIFCSASDVVLINTIVWIENFPEPVYFDPDSDTSGITVAYSDIEGGQEGIITNDNGEVNWLEHNIDDDPLFVNADDGIFYLSPGSPCVDVGTAFYVWNNDTLVNYSEDDYMGNAPDMGVFESEFTAVEDIDSALPDSYLMLAVFPNPFNSTAGISYSLPAPEQVTVKIFDLSGREVATLIDGKLEEGNHQVYWNGLNTPSGVYVCRMNAGSFTKSIKLALIR